LPDAPLPTPQEEMRERDASYFNTKQKLNTKGKPKK
jgi:hypothetical protein